MWYHSPLSARDSYNFSDMLGILQDSGTPWYTVTHLCVLYRWVSRLMSDRAMVRHHNVNFHDSQTCIPRSKHSPTYSGLSKTTPGCFCPS